MKDSTQRAIQHAQIGSSSNAYGGAAYLALLMARCGTIAVALLNNDTTALRAEALQLLVLVINWYEHLD